MTDEYGDAPCEKCRALKGKVLTYDEEGRCYAGYCDCGYLKRKEDRDRLKFARIPEIYKGKRLSDVNNMYSADGGKHIKGILDLLNMWLETIDEQLEEGQGFYFWSDKKGSGKTMMMCCLANELCDRGHSVKFATSPDILNEIKASWNREEQISESELLRQFSTTAILIIDDFGTEQAKDWVSERFYQIIDNRYRNQKLTLFTSNYEPDNLPYGDRISNRIIERSLIIHFPEESVRTKLSAARNSEMKKKFPEAFK